MKKIFTLIAAALLTTSVNAQEVETLALSIDTYPWNYTATSGSASITFTSQWGEYGLIGTDNAINPADYKGYKIEYTAYPETAAEDGSYVQISMQNDHYLDFDPNVSVLEQDFADDVKALTSLTKINVQGKAAGAKIDINKFTLIKNDGTAEATNLAAGGWGHSTGPSTSANVKFTGQYGGIALVQLDGTSCGFIHADEGDNAYAYTIELANTTENTVMIEFDNTSKSGVIWNNLEAGLNSISFVLSKETAVVNTYENDQLVSSTPTDIGYIYLKANAEGGYPFDVNVTKIYRVKTTIAGIENVNAQQTLQATVNAPIFNLAGQQVTKSYKGVVIQNGKKFVQK